MSAHEFTPLDVEHRETEVDVAENLHRGLNVTRMQLAIWRTRSIVDQETGLVEARYDIDEERTVLLQSESQAQVQAIDKRGEFQTTYVLDGDELSVWHQEGSKEATIVEQDLARSCTELSYLLFAANVADQQG